ncbi:hypothetical protein [Tenacibaculum xiamenense]|uniref:hypothetical protein n=1 Tax=Tenacibaculum xiamenense TaxID=1261553 RepID=UPI0038965599
MKRILIFLLILLGGMHLRAQDNSNPFAKKTRLNFAKTYYELGGSYVPSFTGEILSNSGRESIKHSGSFNTNLSWGGFHFWGHAEFFVSFPLRQFHTNENTYNFKHVAVTGARFLPWAFREKKLRPYIGLNWSAFDFQQGNDPINEGPKLEKNFSLVPNIGILYGYKNFAVRLGADFFLDNEWQYPISKNEFATIHTPKYSLNLSLLYYMESSADNKYENSEERWNSYPTVSSLGYNSNSFGDFFVGIGPSISFSLSQSEYLNDKYPYLEKRKSSESYFDIALGYQFNKLNMFTALSFRNPEFIRSAFGEQLRIKKTSFALEFTKFLTDYSGFAPYVGLNIAYDKINLTEKNNTISYEHNFKRVEPGFTFGWDIVPGKTEEYLVLRTNLRWYPFANYTVNGKRFKIDQLEYNLIQVLFYPQRFLRAKKIRLF